MSNAHENLETPCSFCSSHSTLQSLSPWRPLVNTWEKWKKEEIENIQLKRPSEARWDDRSHARYSLGQRTRKEVSLRGKDKETWLCSPIHTSLGLPCWVLKHEAAQDPRHTWACPSSPTCLTRLSLLTFTRFLDRDWYSFRESEFASFLRYTVKKLYESVCFKICVYWSKNKNKNKKQSTFLFCNCLWWPGRAVILEDDNIFQSRVFLQVWSSGWMLRIWGNLGLCLTVLENLLNYRFSQEMGTR